MELYSVMSILVTGGLGYIGSHTVVELCEKGYDVVIIDNCCNSSIQTLHTLRSITGCPLPFYEVDISDYVALHGIIDPFFHMIDNIIHFAALKDVGESNDRPFDYYQTNVVGLLNIVRFAGAIGCKNLIFSSSCTVYSDVCAVPYREDGMAGAGNVRYNTIISGNHPYGTSKIMGEQILHDLCAADPTWNVVVLRYFNPAGSHASGLIGDPFYSNRKHMNLFPAILRAKANGAPIKIFGDTYPTPDGTAIRDYIHVCDVAAAHVDAAEWSSGKGGGISCFNIGLGKGVSVKEIVQEFEAQGFSVATEIVERRKGDAAMAYADTALAVSQLGWAPRFSLQDMVRDTILYFTSSTRPLAPCAPSAPSTGASAQ
jgi:UDP-glucose 4-epimerase